MLMGTLFGGSRHREVRTGPFRLGRSAPLGFQTTAADGTDALPRRPIGPIGSGRSAGGIVSVASDHVAMRTLDRNRHGRSGSPASSAWRDPAELRARRVMLLILVTALVLTAAIVLASSFATLS